jgi:hypothetical protein
VTQSGVIPTQCNGAPPRQILTDTAFFDAFSFLFAMQLTA